MSSQVDDGTSAHDEGDRVAQNNESEAEITQRNASNSEPVAVCTGCKRKNTGAQTNNRDDDGDEQSINEEEETDNDWGDWRPMKRARSCWEEDDDDVSEHTSDDDADEDSNDGNANEATPQSLFPYPSLGQVYDESQINAILSDPEAVALIKSTMTPLDESQIDAILSDPEAVAQLERFRVEFDQRTAMFHLLHEISMHLKADLQSIPGLVLPPMPWLDRGYVESPARAEMHYLFSRLDERRSQRQE